MGYGETTKQTVSTVYKVESNFPTADPGRVDTNERFGTYYAHAYTDIRDPGKNKPFLKANPECNKGLIRGESLVYSDVLSALACAALLRRTGVLACRYETDQEWNLRDRGMPLRVRVVECHSVEINRVCEPEA